MTQYLPCPHCKSRIINRFQHYDICGCQVRGGLDDLTPAERETIKELFPKASVVKGQFDLTPAGREARWLREAERYFVEGQIDEGDAVLEAVLLDHPRSEAAKEMLRYYHGQKEACA